MNASLIDPTGKEIKSVEIISNSEGMFSEERLKITTSGEVGLWRIEISSGANLDKIEFIVLSSVDGMELKVNEEVKVGDLFKMQITASKKTSIEIEILNMEGDEIQKFTCITTKEFKCESFWSVPKDTIPGTYTVKAHDVISSTEATFEIIKK